MTSLTAKNILKNKQDLFKNSGTECLFIKISKNWGVKFYPSVSARDGAYNFQKKAAKVNAGPDVGGKLQLDHDKYGQIFGYLTRTAVVLGNFYTEIPESELDRIKREMYNIGYEINDYHGGNLGEYKGKLVNIDFGTRESGELYHFE